MSEDNTKPAGRYQIQYTLIAGTHDIYDTFNSPAGFSTRMDNYAICHLLNEYENRLRAEGEPAQEFAVGDVVIVSSAPQERRIVRVSMQFEEPIYELNVPVNGWRLFTAKDLRKKTP